MTETASIPSRSHAVLALVRALWHLLAIVAVTLWGFLGWQFPMPSVIVGIVVFIVAVLFWAMFLSPKPAVRRADRFVKSMIELLLLAAAFAALVNLGVSWVYAAAFAIVGAIVGYIAGASAER